MRNLFKVLSRNRLISWLFGFIVVLVFISATLILNILSHVPPHPPVTPTVLVTSTLTVTPLPQMTATPTATPTLQITATPTPTPVTPTPTQEAKSATYTGICLADRSQNSPVSSEGFTTETITTTLYPEFPTSGFGPWCLKNEGISHFLTTSLPKAWIRIDLSSQPNVKSLFLMATVSGAPNNSEAVARITYTYKNSQKLIFYTEDIVPGENIANSNYHQSQLHVNPGAAYRVWSGWRKDHTGAQVVVLALDPLRLDTNPLISIEIEHLGSPLSLNLYGFMVSDLPLGKIIPPPNTSTQSMKSLCLDDKPNDIFKIEYSGRIQDYNSVIDVNRDYYAMPTKECASVKLNSIYFVENLPDKLLDQRLFPASPPPNWPQIRIPFLLGPKIYESRPENPNENHHGVITKPTITITLSPTQKLTWVHLAVSARNLCNLDMSKESRKQLPKLGSIKIYADNNEKAVGDENIIVGKNIRQGRSGIESNCWVKDEYEENVDARIDPKNTPHVGIPLASLEKPDTDQKLVALWVDVISIQIPADAGPITKIVLTDEMMPDPNRHTVDFNDPYLVLYGVTIQTAQ